jgi:hypothetical protein
MDQILPQEALPLWKREWKNRWKGKKTWVRIGKQNFARVVLSLSCFGQRKTAVDWLQLNQSWQAGTSGGCNFFQGCKQSFQVAIFFNLIFLLSQLALTF